MSATNAKEGIFDRSQVVGIILEAIKDSNELRAPESRIEAGETAPLFGGDGKLDSLGLVALLMDIEEMLLDIGVEVTLSSEDAMSRSSSPYRNVASLADYILSLNDVTE